MILPNVRASFESGEIETFLSALEERTQRSRRLWEGQLMEEGLDSLDGAEVHGFRGHRGLQIRRQGRLGNIHSQREGADPDRDLGVAEARHDGIALHPREGLPGGGRGEGGRQGGQGPPANRRLEHDADSGRGPEV